MQVLSFNGLHVVPIVEQTPTAKAPLLVLQKPVQHWTWLVHVLSFMGLHVVPIIDPEPSLHTPNDHAPLLSSQ